ncbi:MAG: DUF1311 domain-containing protein [Rhodospirillales bacterium]|nr:DUF1311 domain-containing protein [Rhodospirillales bacterium]MCB9973366.1 DUF1311 domain-containing protein [Rhodospirillales bacterium]
MINLVKVTKFGFLGVLSLIALESRSARAEILPLEKPPLFINFCEKAKTPADMQACTQKRFENAAQALNTQFQYVQTFFRNTPHQETLTLAQNSWIEYRNLECAFEAGFFEEEIAKRTLELGCLSRLTEERAMVLFQFVPRVRSQNNKTDSNTK